MSPPHRGGWWSRRVRAHAVVGTLGLALLGASVGLGARVLDQTGELVQRTEATGKLAEANVRTVSQAQRELLTLQRLLATGAGRPELSARAEFVSQRTQESALAYQITTLGSADLLELAREADDAWRRRVRPLTLVAAGQPGDSAVRRRAVRAVADLELEYNFLASQAEINRRTQAVRANVASADLLERTKAVFGWLAGVFLAAVLMVAVAGALLIRSQRRHDRTMFELTEANRELGWASRLIEAAGAMLTTADQEGRITWTNAAYERATGWSAEEVVGRRLEDLVGCVPSNGPALAALRRAIDSGTAFRIEVAHPRRDAPDLWMAIDGAPVHDTAGVVQGWFAVHTDLTERREAEAWLRAARQTAEESAAEKAAFLATMSHEIRTPLNAVLGLTELLLLTDLDPEQVDYASTAQRSGRHLLALVNDVLDYSALEAGRMSFASARLQPSAMVRDVMAMFAPDAEARGIDLVLRPGAGLDDWVVGDEQHLRQVLVNLVGNALKFTERGSVTVTADVHDDEAGTVLVVSIADTGIGIPESRQGELFRSFSRGDHSATRSHGGTGLGLAICRQLVDGMGGHVGLVSREGEGTVAAFQVPVARLAAEETTPDPETGRPEDRADLRVLLAEDDPVNRTVVLRMLERLGVTPTVVTDGRAAVDAVLARSASEPYDLVLMDVEMPVMDGTRATRLIREAALDRQPRIVALTANALPGDRERFLEAGMDDYLSKPLALDALERALGRGARQRSEAGAGA